MQSLTLTQAELFDAVSQETPLVFLEGTRVTISDMSVSFSANSTSLQVINELGEIFKMNKLCLFTISAQPVYVERNSPLQFIVLRTLNLQCVNGTNWLSPPFNRFAFRNVSMVQDVDMISNHVSRSRIPMPLQSSAMKLPQKMIESVNYISHDGSLKDFLYMLMKTHTDGIVILRNGNIIYENYFDGQNEHTPHIQFSVTKSLLGMIVAQLIVDGVIDPEKKIVEYIPELAGSAFADARVVEVLDMTTALRYNEEYENPASDVRRHMLAGGYLKQPPEYEYEKTNRTFLPTIKKEGKHDDAFHYVSANTEVLSWVVERATELNGSKKTVTELFVDKIWSKIGVEHNADILKDSVGTQSWSGGFSAATRDMARIGQMILQKGKVGNEQLISQKAFQYMQQRDRRRHFAAGKNETTEAMKGWSYANQFWWTHNENDAFSAIGIYGQLLYIDPKANVVIAKNSSHVEPEGNWLEYDAFIALHSLIKQLEKSMTANL